MSTDFTIQIFYGVRGGKRQFINVKEEKSHNYSNFTILKLTFIDKDEGKIAGSDQGQKIGDNSR